MSIRSTLLMVADDLRSDGMNGETIGDKDAASLIEIDQLLSQAVELMGYFHREKGPTKESGDWILRMSDAGY